MSPFLRNGRITQVYTVSSIHEEWRSIFPGPMVTYYCCGNVFSAIHKISQYAHVVNLLLMLALHKRLLS